MKVWQAKKISGMSEAVEELNRLQLQPGHKVENITEAGSCCYTIFYTVEDLPDFDNDLLYK